ncbi:hypothetical protein DC498_24410 [Terrimonas sp.]|nr:hypothetical protein DC498_24410 [Terrimonas sp.]
MIFSEVYIYFILLASLAACRFYFEKRISIYLYLLSPFLLLTFLVEIIALWMGYNARPNVWLYNFFMIIQPVFYFLLVRNVIRNKRMRSFLLFVSWLYPLFVIINIFFLQPRKDQFVSISYATGTLIIVLSTIFYFYELFTSDKYINLARDPFFWICSGLLFFYSCGFPLFALNNFLSSSSNIFIKNYTSIISLLNILLYSSFIIASLCRIRIRNSFF